MVSKSLSKIGLNGDYRGIKNGAGTQGGCHDEYKRTD